MVVVGVAGVAVVDVSLLAAAMVVVGVAGVAVVDVSLLAAAMVVVDVAAPSSSTPAPVHQAWPSRLHTGQNIRVFVFL
jgi:hypothetical protein